MLAFLQPCLLGHAALVSPPSRNAVDRFLPAFHDGMSPQTPCTCPNKFVRNVTGDHGSLPCDQGVRSTSGGQPCLWWSQGCTIGCDHCDGENTQTHGKRLCEGTMEPTLPDWARTMNIGIDGGPQDTYRYHPWRAPGAAPVDDACGRAGGTTPMKGGPGGHGGADAVFTNTSVAKFGELGSRVLPYAPSGTVWYVGTTVEVSWGITYNHGGGYSYRLCPRGEALTEECFRKLPLEFDRTRQALLWNNGTSRFALNGTFVDTGTTPVGSVWARNPVPRMGEPSHGCLKPNASSSGADDCVSFLPPCPQDCTGRPDCASPGGETDPGTQQGACSGDWKGGVIVDGVIVPAVPPGQYVLGWRYDCEETTQVWASCSDITICERGQPCDVPPPYKPPPPALSAAETVEA